MRGGIPMKYLVPGYVYTPGGLHANKAISIYDDGRIGDITPYAGSHSLTPMDHVAAEVVFLPGVALLPGFVNTHSHVFQRALRGHTHRPLSPLSPVGRDKSGPYAQQDTF